MGIFKKHGNWYIDYYDQNRKRRREKIGPNKRQAEIVLQKRKVEVAENKFLDVRKTRKIRFDNFAKEYLEVYAKPNKKSWRRDRISIDNLTTFFGNRHLHEIGPIDIEKYKRSRIGKVTKSTINRELACLKTIFNKAIEWGKAYNNPVRKIKFFPENNRRLRYLTKEEIKTLYDACCDHLKPIIMVAITTGMRKSEILNLKWEDVDFHQRIIYLIDTKNNEKREIPMNDAAFDTLLKVKKHSNSPYIFCNNDGKPYTDIKKGFYAALRRSGIKNFRFHDLRHTFASHLAMAGVDLHTIKELLGHKDIKMTQRYAHLSPDHKRSAVNTLCNKVDTIWTPSKKEKKLTVDDVLCNTDQ